MKIENGSIERIKVSELIQMSDGNGIRYSDLFTIVVNKLNDLIDVVNSLKHKEDEEDDSILPSWFK